MAVILMTTSANGQRSGPDPSFLVEPENVTTEVGRRVVLQCRVENIPENMTVQWTRDGFGLGDDRELKYFERYRMIGQNWKSKILLISFFCPYIRIFLHASKVSD